MDPSIGITSRLLFILQQNTQFEDIKAIEQVWDIVEQYRDQFKQRRKEVGTTQMVKDICELIDSELDNEPAEVKATYSCRAGCAHCCHIRVDISAAEAETIIEYCDQNNIHIDKQVLKEQAGATEQERPMMKHSACVFLGRDNMCKIYAMRPIACRKYFVTSHPDLCNYITNGKGLISSIGNTQVEMIASGMVNASKGGEMASMLLQALDKYNNNGPK